MISDIRARFMPRFKQIAEERLARVRAAIDQRTPRAVTDELHALAGEAAVLGIGHVADAARAAEAAARAGGDAALAKCAELLPPLENALRDA